MTFLQSCERRLSTLAVTPQARGASQALQGALENATALEYTPSSVPAVASIHSATDTQLSRECIQISAALAWTPSFRMTDAGETVALMTFNDLFDLGALRCGFVYADAQRAYPEHQHEPQELYLILSGTGRWRHGGSEAYEAVTPDSIIYNHPHDLHGVQAGATPVLALYVLW